MTPRRKRWPRLWGCGLVIMTILALGAQGGLTSGGQKNKSKGSLSPAVNPCRTAEQFIKQAGGDPKMFSCLPLKIKVVWEEEDKAVNYAGRAEWHKLTLIEEYYAYLLLTYESKQKKQKQLFAWDILGPAPLENGLISCSVEDFQGSITGEYTGWINNPSQKYKEFPFDNVLLMKVIPRDLNPPSNYTFQFYAKWDRMINRYEVHIGQSLLERDTRGIMPEPYEPVPGGTFKGCINAINVSGPKALTYNEIMGGIKSGLVIKYFSEKQGGLTVDVTVFIEFGKR